MEYFMLGKHLLRYYAFMTHHKCCLFKKLALALGAKTPEREPFDLLLEKKTVK